MVERRSGLDDRYALSVEMGEGGEIRVEGGAKEVEAEEMDTGATKLESLYQNQLVYQMLSKEPGS